MGLGFIGFKVFRFQGLGFVGFWFRRVCGFDLGLQAPRVACCFTVTRCWSLEAGSPLHRVRVPLK